MKDWKFSNIFKNFSIDRERSRAYYFLQFAVLFIDNDNVVYAFNTNW